MNAVLRRFPAPCRKLCRNKTGRAFSMGMIIVTLMMVIPVIVINVMEEVENHKYKVYKEPSNPFYEITIPPEFGRPESSVFKYADLLNSTKDGACLQRSKARHEFVRVLGKNLRSENLKDPQMLIVGASTALGAAISRKFAYKGIPFIAINGINEIDFSGKDAEIMFENVTIAKAFIAYQPPLIRHSMTDGSTRLDEISAKYINGLTSFLKKRDVPFVFAPTGPIAEETMEKALKNGGCVVQMPFLIDSLAFHDLENPMMRAVRECRKVGRTTIETAPGASVHSITANEASKFVRKQIKHDDDLKKGRFSIYGASNISVEEAVKLAVATAGYGDCDVTVKNYPHSIFDMPETTYSAQVGGEDADVREMVKSAFNNFTRPEKEGPYMSFVIVGRHDNFSKGFERRAQNFLDTLDANLKAVPLADIELVFVDYATPLEKNPLLKEALKIGENLKGRVRYVVVTQDTHVKLITRMNRSISFLEYVAKNIGIRRSKGKFILTTNPDDLFSLAFFELIAARQFNTALFYRATRWDNRQDTNYTIPDLVRGLNEPWEMETWDVNIRCTPYMQRFTVIDSFSAYNKKNFPCGAGDFLLMSKKLWDVIEGFNEFPANPNVDSVFTSRMMKLVPGYTQMIMYPPILHQRHVKRNIFRPSVENMTDHIEEYCCTGRCRVCGQFAETENWGASDEVFEEFHC